MEDVKDSAGTGEGARTPRSSDRVLRLLLAAVERIDDGRGATLTELAELVELAPSTALRQLASLEAADLLGRSDVGYVAGPALLRLAHRVVADHPLPASARPLLVEAARTTGETCVLAVPHGPARALYVSGAEGHHTLRVTGWVGRDVPRAGSAVGRALAGELPSGRTAVGRDTVEPGVTAVSGAVRDARGDVVAAVSLLGPSARLRDEQLSTATGAVVSVCVGLGRLLGG